MVSQMPSNMQKFAVLCGSGEYENFISETGVVKAKTIDEAFEKSSGLCGDYDNAFVFPLNQVNAEKLKKILAEMGEKNV
jgi:hypothetical protein